MSLKMDPKWMRAVLALGAAAVAFTAAACSGTGQQTDAGVGPSDSASSAPDGSSTVARLSVSGTQILDPNKKAIVLRGWNWGQWGTVQPQDGADNAAQGATVVRIVLRWWGPYGDPSNDSRDDAQPGHIDVGHLMLLDQTIKQAADAHLWVALAVDSNCGQASVANDTLAYCGAASDGTPANFYNSPAMKQKFIEVWQYLAARYKNAPYMGMYEILPEPSFTCSMTGCTDYTSAPTFYASVIPSIRAVDPIMPILIGPDNGYDVRKLATAYIPDMSGLIYTGDFLAFSATHPEWLSYATDFQTQKNVPIFIQQLGVRSSDMNAQSTANTMFTSLAADSIGWTWWTYREKGQPTGGGYAPWYLDSNSVWQQDKAWLAVITGHLQ